MEATPIHQHARPLERPNPREDREDRRDDASAEQTTTGQLAGRMATMEVVAFAKSGEEGKHR